MGIGVGPAEAGLPALTDVLSGSGFGLRLLSRISLPYLSVAVQVAPEALGQRDDAALGWGFSMMFTREKRSLSSDEPDDFARSLALNPATLPRRPGAPFCKSDASRWVLARGRNI